MKVRAELRDGAFGREIGLEDFGTFFDKVFLTYAKEHKASWKHDEFSGKVLKEFFAGKTFGEITPMLLAQYVNVRLKAFSKRKDLFDPTTIHIRKGPWYLQFLIWRFGKAWQSQIPAI
jgi:hypothetical protein